MLDPGFEVRSQVVSTGNVGIPGLRVVAVDAPGGRVSMLLTAMTGEDGKFTFNISTADATAFFRLAEPGDMWNDTKELHLSVYNGTVLLATTTQSVSLKHFAQGTLDSILTVDTTGTASETYDLRGRVLDAEGQPQVGVVVAVNRIVVGSTPSELATDTTDSNGAFVISYAGHDDSTPDDPKMDVQVVAQGSPDDLARSPVIRGVKPSHRVDLVIEAGYTGRTEFERMASAVSGLSGTSAHLLTAEDVELGAAVADEHPLHMAMYVQAARMANGRSVDASALYALMRAGLPSAMPDLLSRPLSEMRSALTSAYTSGLLRPPLVGTIDDAVNDAITDLSALVVDASMATGSLRDVLDTSGLTEATLRDWVELWIGYEGTYDEFWDEVRTGGSFTTPEADTLAFTAEAAALTNHHLVALTGLQTERNMSNISTVRDLAAWDVSDWVTFVTPIGAPSGMTVQAYAETLNRIVETRYPTASLARRLERDEPPGYLGVPEFLDDNPDFDIERTVIAAYLEDNPGAMPGGFDPDVTEANLAGVQRVYTLTPFLHRYDVSQVLLTQGITSATEIVRQGQAGFVARFTSQFDGVHPSFSGTDLARLLYGNAAEKVAMVNAAMSHYAKSTNQVGIAVLPGNEVNPEAGSGAATLADLFGSVDYCACKHCRSVFGPAAYLVDLLSFLEGMPGTGSADGLEALRLRRPDIPGTTASPPTGIELSCENTNTVMPYVDLVNELLEQRAANPSATLVANQTTWTSAELRLNPEHRATAAYDEVGLGVFPWALPIDIPGEEMRAYLDQLGVSRLEFMQTLQPEASLDPLDLVAESLGLARLHLDIITGDTSPLVSTDDAWGAGGTTGLANDLALLLDKAEIDFEQLLTLLDLDFTGGGSISLAYDNGDPSCDLADISLDGFDTAAADRFHRFVRLARATGRSWQVLDALIRLIGGDVLDQAFVAALVALGRVESRLGLDAFVAASLWGDLDTEPVGDDSSLYEQLFLSRLVTQVPDPNFTVAAVTSMSPAELGEVHHPTIRAALGVNDDDLARLIALLPATPDLDLANLSVLHRNAVLARALGISIADLLRLRELVSVDPFASAADTLAFAEIADEIASTSMSIEQIDYICRHEFGKDSGLQPTAGEIDDLVLGIQSDIAALDVELALDGEPAANVRAHLEAVFGDSATVEEWIRILGLDQLETSPPIDRERLEADLTSIGLEPMWVDTLAAMYLESPPSVDERYVATSDLLSGYRRDVGVDAIVAKALSDAAGITPEAASVLAKTIVVFDESPPLSGQGMLISPERLDNGAAGTDQITAYLLIHKAAMLINGLEIATSDLLWYFGDPLGAQSFDLNALLDDSPAPDPYARFQEWRALRLGQELQEEFSTADSNVIFDAVMAGTIGDANDLFAESSTWQIDDLNFAAGSGWLDLGGSGGDSIAYSDPFAVAKLRDLSNLVRRTGVRAETLAGWASTSPTSSDAEAALRAMRARYADSAWPSVMEPIADKLREQRRDALIALILGRGDFANEIELYEYLLVDPKMSACALTSRIKLALSAVQLFIQRAYLHLEADEIEFPDGSTKRWEWMKNYRVWEANRKVFFYPENWIEPDLRDDKSEFFVELEGHLNQGDLSDFNVEQGFKEYLYRLHEVSHLDTVCLFEDPLRAVHVVARTRSEPRKYFYRKRIEDRYWTPWSEIPVEINSNHIVLTIHNRRPFLFWLKLLDHVEDGLPNVRRLHLSWTEFRDGEWKPTKMLNSERDVGGTFSDQHLFLQTISFGALIIDVVRDTAIRQTVARFRYDDCLDEVFDVGGTFQSYAYSNANLGNSGRTLVHQQQVAQAGAFAFALKHASITQPQQLILRPSAYRVTLVHSTPIVDGREPVVYDDQNHGLYIVPAWLPPGHFPKPVGIATSWDIYALTDTPIEPSAASQEDPISFELDTVIQAQPWGGQIPGREFSVSGGIAVRSEREQTAGMALLVAHELAETSSASTELELVPGSQAGKPTTLEHDPLHGWRLDVFHHPYTCLMLSQLNRRGVVGVLAGTGDLARQQGTDVHFLPPGSSSATEPVLTYAIAEDYPVDSFDFSPGGAYSVYNWELFFHAPMLIAERLRSEGKYEEAQRWYHYIFDPRVEADASVGSERFWKIKPLFEEAAGGTPDIIKETFSNGGLNAGGKVSADFASSIAAWLRDPFSPHAIARWRPGTYRWAVVRKYLDNLIDWADSLFRRDTIESINEATQLYLLASAILGPRPKQLPETNPLIRTYAQLDTAELFGGFIQLENAVSSGDGFGGGAPGEDNWHGTDHDPPPPIWWYFCLPPNDKLLAYWDTIADRLFKIRNCQNIDGLFRQLPLFQPPIDPALLVKAKAAGLDLSTVLDGLSSPMPHHRYRVLVARALDLCNDVKSLGGALLSALEKRDSEALAQLKATHEIVVHESGRASREAAVEEAGENIAAIQAQMETTRARRGYYAKQASQKRSPEESKHLEHLSKANRFMKVSQALKLSASVTRLVVPTFTQFPLPFTKFGGETFAGVLDAVADGFSLGSTVVRNRAERTQINAGYTRRQEDWSFQRDQAAMEVKQQEVQLLAAQIRQAITKHDLASFERQLETLEEYQSVLEGKYTNDQLYAWMISQVSQLYYQSYKLAYDMAKKAERAMQRELAISDSFVDFGYWDSLRKGLLAGERLGLDLKRMESAYLDRNAREHEITKRISLRQIDPDALLDLRSLASCDFVVPEVLFDLDHPGHYMRRIKAVTVSIPAVTGPHTTLGAKLTLTQDVVRIAKHTGSDSAYVPLDPLYSDARFVVGYGGTSAIATSHGRNDSGLFNLDFGDERYLPFEGAGAISSWRLELPDAVRQFDYDTISDVEIQIQYTARDGGSGMRSTVDEYLATLLNNELVSLNNDGLMLMLSAKAAFPVEFERLLYPATGEEGDPIDIPIVLERFPYPVRARGPRISSIRAVFVVDAESVITPSMASDVVFTDPDSPSHTMEGTLDWNTSGRYYEVSVDTSPVHADVPVTDSPWMFDLGASTIDEPENVKDLIILVEFDLQDLS
jgi:hypothetical protein